MNIKTLTELDEKGEARRQAITKELEVTNKNISEVEREITRMTLSGDNSGVDNATEKLYKLTAKKKAQEATLDEINRKRNPFYTNDDVFEGFKDDTVGKIKEFERLRKSYLDNLEKAFKDYKKMAEIRLSVIDLKKAYVKHLEEDTLQSDITANMKFPTIVRTQINDKEAIDWFAYYDGSDGFKARKEAGDDNVTFSTIALEAL